MYLFLEGNHRCYKYIFFFLPLRQIFSLSLWITRGSHMLENVKEGAFDVGSVSVVLP